MKKSKVFLSILIIVILLLNIFIGVSAQNKKKLTKKEDKDTIINMIEKIDKTLIYSYHADLMSFGPRYTGSQNCSDAGGYIYQVFRNLGLDVRYHNWEYDGFKSRNIVASLQGYGENAATYIISAHYDCTPNSLGADDDGSGIAALLSIAEVMKEYKYYNNIRFVAFSGEEVGTYGSYCYARDVYKKGENIRGLLNIDMIGYANSSKGGKILRFHCPKRSEWIGEMSRNISLKYQELIDMTVQLRPNYRGADHQAFVDYGYDGVWIAHPDGYPWANSPDDTADHLNWTYQTKATKLLLTILVEMAQKPLPVQIYLKKPYEGSFYLKNKSICSLDFGKMWYSETRGVTVSLGSTLAEAEVLTNEEIKYVVFCINNNFVYFDDNPPYKWQIQGKNFPLLGKNTLRVYAFTKQDNIAFDEMDLMVFTVKF
ncbi:MAG: M28 family peptidase [Candidatus Thermoplasmatota archaeon]